MDVITTSSARKELYQLINTVVASHQPVEIINTKEDKSVVMIGKSDWESIQETLCLKNGGILDEIQLHENEATEELGDVDWDSL